MAVVANRTFFLVIGALIRANDEEEASDNELERDRQQVVLQSSVASVALHVSSEESLDGLMGMEFARLWVLFWICSSS